MRMHNHRFTRLTNAFSETFEHHAPWSRSMRWYIFHRIDKSLRASPAMPAGIADRLRRTEDVAEMVEAGLPKPGKRGPYTHRDPEKEAFV